MRTGDYPPPDEPFDLDAYSSRWPTGAEKVELVRGCLAFYGKFEQQDADAAQRAFPGRRVSIRPEYLVIYPAGWPDDSELPNRSQGH